MLGYQVYSSFPAIKQGLTTVRSKGTHIKVKSSETHGLSPYQIYLQSLAFSFQKYEDRKQKNYVTLQSTNQSIQDIN